MRGGNIMIQYRKLFVAGLLSSLVSISIAQPAMGSHPLLKEGKTWNYESWEPLSGEEPSHFALVVKGDTVVRGVTYRKLMRVNDQTETLEALMREEGKKVFAIRQNGSSDDEVLLYDFSLSLGETLGNGAGGGCTVGLVDTICVKNCYFCRFHLQDETGDVCYCWVEGVGGTYGVLEAPVWDIPVGHTVTTCKSCYEDGVCIFTDSDFMAAAIHAQNPHFIEKGKTWQTRYSVGYYNDYMGIRHEYPFRFYMEGDTLVGGTKYTKMYADRWNDRATAEYLMAMREEGQKVFFVSKDSEEEHLLYDFGAEAGDVVNVYHTANIENSGYTPHTFPQAMRVLKAEERMIDGESRKCLLVMPEAEYQYLLEERGDFVEDLDALEGSYAGWWIEGIGTECSPLDNVEVGLRMDGGHTLVLCSQESDTLYYTNWYEKFHDKVMVDGGMAWEELHATANPKSPIEPQHLFFKMEVPIWQGGKLCRKLYASAEGVNDEEARVVATLHEEDGKVYFYPWKDSEDLQLLYDFTAQTGDELEVSTFDPGNDFETAHEVVTHKCRVDSVAYHEVHGRLLRHLYLSVADSNGIFPDTQTSKVCWVEGIGTASGLLANILTETSAQQILVKCRWLDEVFYEQNPDTLPFMVNVKTIPSETPRPLTPILHDLTGRRLTTPPAKGVYIENGVKRVK